MGEKLSTASPYEQTFKTRYRGPGRPRDDDGEPLFPSSGRPALLVKTAQRRAQALVLYEERARLSEVFEREMRVLMRRGVAEVALDLGYEEPAEDLVSAGVSV